MLQNILSHSKVTRAVAEHKNRAFSNLIDNREYFVGILVFGDKVSFHQDLVIRGNRVFAAGFTALAGCDERKGASDHTVPGNPLVKGSFDQFAHHRALGTAADENGKLVFRKVFHHFCHRFVESFRICHPLKSENRAGHVFFDIFTVLIYCHPLKTLGCALRCRLVRIRFRQVIVKSFFHCFRILPDIIGRRE